MDKININNLFPATTLNDFQPLDVQSLFNLNEQKNRKKINFNMERLIKLREERKNKVLSQYEKVFGFCLNKISLANTLNKLEVVYDVPEAMFGSFEYNSIDCLLYIDNKLKDMGFETLLISNSSLYISWLNLGKAEKSMDEN